MSNYVPDIFQSYPLPGSSIDTVDTPALVVNLDAMERNIERMAAYAKQNGMRLRPHAKMHKSAELALLQMNAGAVGVCVQKTSEAEVLVNGNVNNVYISNEVVAPSKLARVAHLALKLAARGGRLAIAVDSVDGVRRLAHAFTSLASFTTTTTLIDVFVEIDAGHGRCGIEPGIAAVPIAQEICASKVLRFAGLQAYHGSAQHVRDPKERQGIIARAIESVGATKVALVAAGISVDLVTGAGTGTFNLEASSGVYGELQVGSYLFMDADYAKNELADGQLRFEHALFVKTQVISLCSDHAVCDAGHKSHAVDSGLPSVLWPRSNRSLSYLNAGDEHGVLRGDHLPALGETLWLIPGHCDPTVNLHNFIVGVRGGIENGTVERLIRVDARGAIT